jgi:L-ribulose-5-phosphate 4-epimerase
MSTATPNATTQQVDETLLTFVAQVKADVSKAAKLLLETGTLSATRTFGVSQRVPGQQIVVSAGLPSAWDADQEIRATVTDFDGNILWSDKAKPGGKSQAIPLFRAHEDITTFIHFHSPYLGAWASAHRSLPILYVVPQRYTRARDLPVYVDRRESQVSFILKQLQENPHHLANLEANGGASAWGNGVLKVAQFILNLEEGARFQTHAEALGGSQPYGPNVLEQQWGRGLLPA